MRVYSTYVIYGEMRREAYLESFEGERNSFSRHVAGGVDVLRKGRFYLRHHRIAFIWSRSTDSNSWTVLASGETLGQPPKRRPSRATGSETVCGPVLVHLTY